MLRMIFQILMEFILSLDTAYAHLIPMPHRTAVTSKQGHSWELIYISFAKCNHLISSFLEKKLPFYTGVQAF